MSGNDPKKPEEAPDPAPILDDPTAAFERALQEVIDRENAASAASASGSTGHPQVTAALEQALFSGSEPETANTPPPESTPPASATDATLAAVAGVAAMAATGGSILPPAPPDPPRDRIPPPDDPDEREGMALEYVVGTLGPDEREAATGWLSNDKSFADAVAGWTHRLGALHELVDPIEPPPALNARVRTFVAQATADDSKAPARDLGPPPAPLVDPQPDNDNVADLRQRVRRWRGLTGLTAALAAGFVGLTLVREFNPDLLPANWRPVPKVQVVEKIVEKVVEKVVEVPAKVPAQFVAVLQADGTSPGFVLTIDVESRTFTARKVGAQPQQGRAYELWIIHDTLGAPRSLGIVGGNDFTQRAALTSYDPAIINTALYAITVEPEGGAPGGIPSGSPVFAGRLVQATP